MAKYPNITITQAGLNMIAANTSDKKIIYTKIGIGDGSLAENEDIIKLTDMKNKIISADIGDIESDGNGQFTLTTTISNKVVTTGFFAREIGIYAKFDSESEILYGYANAGTNADYLPDNSQPIDELKLKITLIVGNVSNVTAIINSSIIFITLEDCRREISRHNTDVGAHADIRNNYVKKSGDTITGDLQFDTSSTERQLYSTTNKCGLTMYKNGVALYDWKNGKNIFNYNQDNSTILCDYSPRFSGDNAVTFGPNSVWNGVLKVGGNPNNIPAGNASVATSNGNLHIDAAKGHTLYFNLFNGDNIWIGDGTGNGVSLATIDPTYGVSCAKFTGDLHGTADSAKNAGNAEKIGNDNTYMRFHWSGQAGQPTWLWGSPNDGANSYVYNPVNFDVHSAGIIRPLSGDANYKLAYTADGQRTNAGEWGRVVMRYDPNGQTYGVRCDRADYADSAGAVNGWNVDTIKRNLGGRNQPTLTSILDGCYDGNGNKINKIVNAGDGVSGYGTGNIHLTQSYKNFDKILVMLSNDDTNYSIPYLWDTWHLAYAFSTGYRFGITNGTGGSYWTVWTAVQNGTATHPLSTDTIWYLQEENSVLVDIIGVNY